MAQWLLAPGRMETPQKVYGKTPRTSSIGAQDYLRPAAAKAGVISGEYRGRFGWHNLRHSLCSSTRYTRKSGRAPGPSFREQFPSPPACARAPLTVGTERFSARAASPMLMSGFFCRYSWTRRAESAEQPIS